MKTKILTAFTVMAILTGCSSEDSYVGTWLGTCGGSDVDTTVITKLSSTEYLLKDKGQSLTGELKDGKIEIEAQGQKIVFEYIKNTGHILVKTPETNCEYSKMGAKASIASITDTTKIITGIDVKGVIKTIAGKYYIPANGDKSNFIITINQNLDLQLLHYNGDYEGKIVGDKIQFDDSKATKIEFSVKDSLLTLKNENGIAIEFREAQDKDLIVGNWYKSTGATESFTKDGVYSSVNYGSSKYIYKGNKKFVAPDLSAFNSNIICQFKLISPDKLTGSSSYNSYDNWTSTRTKAGKIESLNIIFN